MITVNNRSVEHEKGMTVTFLLEKLNYKWPMLIVRINGKLIDNKQFPTAIIEDGDNVDAIHMMSGG